MFAIKVFDRFDGVCFLHAVTPEEDASSVVSAVLEQRKSRLPASAVQGGSCAVRTEDGTLVPNGVSLGLFCERGTTLFVGAGTGGPAQQPGGDVWVRLNVGGQHMVTTRATLLRDSDSMLARMFGADWPV